MVEVEVDVVVVDVEVDGAMDVSVDGAIEVSVDEEVDIDVSVVAVSVVLVVWPQAATPKARMAAVAAARPNLSFVIGYTPRPSVEPRSTHRRLILKD